MQVNLCIKLVDAHTEDEKNQSVQEGNECEERIVVPRADARPHMWAVMIKPHHAVSTVTTVHGALRPEDETRLAKLHHFDP